MKFEKRLKETRFEKGKWRPPMIFKVGIFKAAKGNLGFCIRTKPLFLIYLFVPNLFKFWLSIECEVFSIWYLELVKYPDGWIPYEVLYK